MKPCLANEECQKKPVRVANSALTQATTMNFKMKFKMIIFVPGYFDKLVYFSRGDETNRIQVQQFPPGTIIKQGRSIKIIATDEFNCIPIQCI